MAKRTIEIGDRKISEMTENEISDLLYHFGYSASSQFWNAPVVEIIDRNTKDSEIWFEYSVTRRSDGLTHYHKGWIRMGASPVTDNAFTCRLVIVMHKDDHDLKSKDLPIQALAWLISKGFNVPIYTDQESYYPKFTQYAEGVKNQ